jgi:ADP-ribose pyrophosphatase YjhB (NUDIX family)
MRSELACFLAPYTAHVTEHVTWGTGTLPLQLAAYVEDELPSLAYITSVRSLVLREDHILVLRNADGTHILPGGRREPGETLEETLRREVAEEAGWSIRSPRLLGFLHFHHIARKPAGYPFPYPDFLQVVYVAHADASHPEARVRDDYEVEARFHPVAVVQAFPLSPSERLYLAAALTCGR